MPWFLNLPFAYQIGFIYFIVLNICTFFFFGIDKIKSQLNSRRINEAALLFLIAIGGSAGAIAGMSFFRHKTKKHSFQSAVIIIILIQIICIYFLWYNTK